MAGDVAEQLGLGLMGLEEARRRAEQLPTRAVRARVLNRVEATHDLLSSLPKIEDLTFNHSGLCQTSLPHARPATNSTVWKRQSGRFTLMIRPGVISGASTVSPARGKVEKGEEDYVGVPFGPKARLIMFHLQTEGLKSRTVSLGRNLSAFLRSLGLEVRGGPRGTIRPIREQALRIGRCTFTMQWDSDNGQRTIITDTNIVDGMDLWSPASEDWAGEVQLSQRFHEHLREHAVPLDRRGIALLSNNSLGLDLYALFAYRLQRLRAPLKLTWDQLQDQIGSEYAETKELSRKVRDVLPTVLNAYPNAQVEVEQQRGRTAGGLILKPSKPAVPKNTVQGYRLVESG
jgi:Plasmid encoded RepA protein